MLTIASASVLVACFPEVLTGAFELTHSPLGLQPGQLPLVLIRLSMQSSWNSWPHFARPTWSADNGFSQSAHLGDPEASVSIPALETSYYFEQHKIINISRLPVITNNKNA